MTIRNKTVELGHLFEGDKVIWMILFFLCIISVLEVYSASSNMTYDKGAYWSPVLMHGLYLLVGVGVAWVVHRIPYRYFSWIVVIGPVLSVLLLVAAMFTKGTNGAARWLSIAGISFQPSEIAKGSLIVVVAWLLSVLRDERGATKSAFKWILGITCIICALIVTENLSTAAFTFLVVMLMMFVGNVPWKQLSALLGLLVIGGAMGYSVLRFTPESTLEKASELPGMKRLTTWAHRVRNHTDMASTTRRVGHSSSAMTAAYPSCARLTTASAVDTVCRTVHNTSASLTSCIASLPMSKPLNKARMSQPPMKGGKLIANG